MRIGFLGAMASQNARTWVEALRSQGAEVHTWSMKAHEKGNNLGLLDIFSDLRRLRSWISFVKPDLVIAYRTTSYGFLAALSGFRPYVTAAQGESDAWPTSGISYFIKRILGYVALNRASRVHAWTRNMLWGLEEMGLDHSKLLLKPRGIDLNSFPFNKVDWECNSIKIVVTRRLFPEYHIDQIIAAFAILIKDETIQQNIELHIAGEGPLKNLLQNKARSLNIDEYVFFHGQLEYNALRNLLKVAHIYCSMPDTEGASASLFEAFAIGLFPIVSDLPANRVWIQNGKNGMLIQQGDIQGLADSFKKVIAQKNQISQILAENRALAENELSLSKNMAFFLEEYTKIIQQFKA
jgi:glycosyltransferase involved in cell wall biosynthesis